MIFSSFTKLKVPIHWLNIVCKDYYWKWSIYQLTSPSSTDQSLTDWPHVQCWKLPKMNFVQSDRRFQAQPLIYSCWNTVSWIWPCASCGRFSADKASMDEIRPVFGHLKRKLLLQSEQPVCIWINALANNCLSLQMPQCVKSLGWTSDAKPVRFMSQSKYLALRWEDSVCAEVFCTIFCFGHRYDTSIGLVAW